MNRTRFIIAVGVGAALLALFGWQLHRESLISACLDSGGAWDGRACGPLKVRPIIQRELHRS